MAVNAGRPRVTVERIVDCAIEVIEAEGLDALTTTNVARRLGVSQPALYAHVANLDEIKERTALRGAAELSERLREAIDDRTGDDALHAIAHAYRDYVRAHPALYLLMLRVRNPGPYLEETERMAEAVRGVFRSYGLDEAAVRDAHRAFRAAIHGFVHLEANGAMPGDPTERDRGFDSFIRLFAAGLRGSATTR